MSFLNKDTQHWRQNYIQVWKGTLTSFVLDSRPHLMKLKITWMVSLPHHWWHITAELASIKIHLLVFRQTVIMRKQRGTGQRALVVESEVPGSNSASHIYYLHDLGQVISLHWASVSSSIKWGSWARSSEVPGSPRVSLCMALNKSLYLAGPQFPHL